jgi:EAL domain-containing protein (putative c-di-GMP-specific phosphodiesterase class I)
MNQSDGAKVLRALAGLGRGLGLCVSINGMNDVQDKNLLIDSGVNEGQESDYTVSATESRQLFATAADP